MSLVTEERAVIDARGVQLDRERDAAGLAELIAVHAKSADRRHAAATRIARASSTSKAPRSQKTSAHLDFGAQAVEHRAAHEVHVAVAVAGVLLGHDVRAEEGHFVAELTGDVEQP